MVLTTEDIAAIARAVCDEWERRQRMKTPNYYSGAGQAPKYVPENIPDAFEPIAWVNVSTIQRCANGLSLGSSHDINHQDLG